MSDKVIKGAQPGTLPAFALRLPGQLVTQYRTSVFMAQGEINHISKKQKQVFERLQTGEKRSGLLLLPFTRHE